MILARRVRFGAKGGSWLGGSSNLRSSHESVFDRHARSETSIRKVEKRLKLMMLMKRGRERLRFGTTMEEKRTGEWR